MKVLSFLAMMVASAAAVPGGWIAAGHHESRIAREAEDTASNAALGVQSRTEQLGDEKCESVSGSCLSGYPRAPCSGTWRSGMCSGPSSRRCCIPPSSSSSTTTTTVEAEDGDRAEAGGEKSTGGDESCRRFDGQCLNGYPSAKCEGSWKSGHCKGPSDYVCCVPPEKNTLFFSSAKSSFGSDPLAGNGGTGNNVALRWNDAAVGATKVDIVVHLHGYSTKKPDDAMTRHAIDTSGAVLTDRDRPTLAIVPRGRKISNRAYDHPTVGKHLDNLIHMALREFEAKNGITAESIKRGRLIVTCHSGGGKNCFPLAEQHDPHELHVFDATYYGTGPLEAWAKRHMAGDARIAREAGDNASEAMAERGHALRMLYKTGTATAARGQALDKVLARADPAIRAYYRAQNARESHMMIPVVWGPRLLQDAGCCQE